MEIRAKLPEGKGLWPAIWMLPTDNRYGGWPLSGEIDIMEAVNPNAGGGNETHGTLHYGRVWPGNLHSGAAYTPNENIWEKFHTYAVEWEQGEIRWYVDDVHFATQTQEDWFTYYWGGQQQGFTLGEDDAPFNQPYHLLLNVAVGGNWPGNPDGTATFPQRMEVDYVRVYECSADPSTGKGCAQRGEGATQVEGHSDPTVESFPLYDNGPASFTFNTPDGEVTHTLVPGFYDGGSGNVISTPDASDGNNTVWDIQFNGPGNAFLSSADMAAYPEVNDGLKFTNMAEYGELRFNMRVESIDPGTELQIKLDSGWPNVSYHVIEPPAVGDWAEVAVAINQLQPNNIEAGQMDLGQLINAFVIEATGVAHVQLADIRVGCLTPCDVDPVLAAVSDTLTGSFSIFANGEPGPNWDFGIGTWASSAGHVTAEVVSDDGRGSVLDIQFSESDANGLAFIQSTSVKNARAFADSGQLTFDIKVLSYGTNTGGLVVKAESGPGQGTGDYTINPAVGDWVSITVDIADMLTAPNSTGFNIDAMNTPFVILPAWGDQSGVHIQVDNIHWVGGTGSSEASIDVIDAPFDVYNNGGPGPLWDFGVGKWDNDTGHITINTVNDTERGDVLQLDFSASGNNGLAFIQATESKDLSAFASEGQLVFDLKVLDFGSNTQGLVVKLESGPAIGTGDYIISNPIANVWTEYTLDIADLLGHAGTNGAFDISAMNTPFVILPVWGDQSGVQLQLDNIRWQFADSSETSSSASSSVATSSSSSSSTSSGVTSSSSSVVSSASSSAVTSSSSSSQSSEVTSSSSSSAGGPDGWTLVWQDEFEGDSIDSSKWEHEVNCWGGGNFEAQCYTDDPANSYVQDGQLVIEARAEATQVCGPAVNQEDPTYDPNDTSACKDYSSARLRTRGKADWKYGRMEIHARMPVGRGMWPAIWMLPTDQSYGEWPQSGEIDIFEAFAPGTTDHDTDPNTVHGTLHYGYSWPWNQNSGAPYIPPANIWDEFHTYAIEWEEGEIRWYVDDVHFATNNGNWFNYHWAGQDIGYRVSAGAQPFDQPFHMILNLAIGAADWLPYPDETTSFPQTMAVDYVRVYECAANPATGKGCATIGDSPQMITGHTPPADTRDELYFYQDGVQTLTLEGDAGEVSSGLTPGIYPEDASTVISTPNATGPEGEAVWELDFYGLPAVAFLTSETGLNFGDNLHSRAKNLGELRFDLRVLDIEPGTKLRIKLDSGWPDLSFHEIEIPTDVGTDADWSEVAVRLWSLQPNDGEWWGPTVDYTHITNPFVIEPVDGTAHVQLKNIRLTCLGGVANCDVKPVEPPMALSEDFDIFVDAVDPVWGNIGQWSASGSHVQISVVDAADTARGQVFEGQFTEAGGNGLMFIQTEPGTVRDVSAFNTGYLVFDVASAQTTEFIVKADCVHPCTSGDRPVSLSGSGDWETVVVPIADFVTGGLDLSKVNTPFAILPAGEQGGVTIQVDNVRWVLDDPRT